MGNELQDNNIRINMARQLENEIRRRYGHIEDNFANEALLAIDCFLDTSVPSIHPLDELETCIIREKLIPGEKGRNKTLKEISVQLNYSTPEAIRRIYLNAYRKLVSRIVFSKVRLKINQVGFTKEEKQHIFTSPNFQIFTDYFHVKGKNLEFYKSIQSKIGYYFHEENMSVQTLIDDSENLSIADMGFHVKAFDCLRRRGITDMKGLITMHSQDIRNIPYLSHTSYAEIIEKMDVITFNYFSKKEQMDTFSGGAFTPVENSRKVLLKSIREKANRIEK